MVREAPRTVHFGLITKRVGEDSCCIDPARTPTRTMCPPLAVLHPGGLRSLEKRCHAVPRDYIAHMDDVSSAASTGSDAHGRRVAHQIPAGRIRRPGAHPPLAEILEQIEQCGDSRLVSVVDDEFANPCLEQAIAIALPALPAPPAPAKEYPRSLRLGSMVFLRLHEGFFESLGFSQVKHSSAMPS